MKIAFVDTDKTRIILDLKTGPAAKTFLSELRRMRDKARGAGFEARAGFGGSLERLMSGIELIAENSD